MTTKKIQGQTDNEPIKIISDKNSHETSTLSIVFSDQCYSSYKNKMQKVSFFITEMGKN